MNNNGNLNNNNKNNNNSVLPVAEVENMPATLQTTNRYSYQDIFNAYLDCRRHKRFTHSAMVFEFDFERNLNQLLEEVNSETYEVGRSMAFVIDFPKVREIWAAQFRDRIVHHLVCHDLMPWFEARFIPNTYACIKGRGVHMAAHRAEHFARSVTDNWHSNAWYLQVDIRNFFLSIDKNILWSQIARHVPEDNLTMRTLRKIIYNDPTCGPLLKESSDFSKVPYHKSLFHAKPHHGLPIGNLPSQFFANVTLDDFDKFIYYAMRQHAYVRYVDDAIVFSKSKTKLREILGRAQDVLFKTTGLELHPDKTHIAPVNEGFCFVGHVIKPFHTNVRSLTWGSACTSAWTLRKYPFDLSAVRSLNSYLGFMRNSKDFSRRKRLCEIARLPIIIGHDPTFTKVFHLI